MNRKFSLWELSVPTRFLPLVCAFLLFGGESPQTLWFDRITPDEGLSQSQVSTILQDRQGFLWFGTNSGLNRYDGHGFEIIKRSPHKDESLTHNKVTALLEDDAGNLWIGTAQGLNRLNNRRDRLQSWPTEGFGDARPTNISALVMEGEDVLWIATKGSGLYRMDLESEDFQRFGKEEGLSHEWLTSLALDSQRRLWIGSWDGLMRRDPDGALHVWRPDPRYPGGLSDVRINTILLDKDSRLWIGTWGGGLNRYDLEKDQFRRWRKKLYDDTQRGLLSDQINTLMQSPDGRIWIGCWGGGVNVYDPRHDDFIQYKTQPFRSNSMPNNWVNALYQDRSGVLWVALDGIGLAKTDLVSTKFAVVRHDPNDPDSIEANAIGCMYKDATGMLWIGSWGGGVTRLDRSNGEIKRWQESKDDPIGSNLNFVRHILADHEEPNFLWVATQGGLGLFDAEEGPLRYWLHDPSNVRSISRGTVLRVVQERDDANRLWLATSHGLNRFDRKENRFLRFEHDPGDSQTISADRIFDIYDAGDVLWLGTDGGGLNRFDKRSQRVDRYRYSSNDPYSIAGDTVNAVMPDSKDSSVLWLGIYGGGLNRFDIRNGRTIAFTEHNSDIANDDVNAILSDDSGILWISTNRGLSRFDPVTEKFRNYDVSDGLQEMEFILGAAHKATDGELFFGGILGLNSFYPGQIYDNPIPPEVSLTGLRLHNQPVGVGGDSPLQRPVWEIEQLELSHRQNDITFEFNAFHYSRPDQNLHAYKLEPYDKRWNYVGDAKLARYTSLDPGEYRFYVRAANSDGVENVEGVEVSLVIRPPWWRTTYAYVGYGLLALGLIFLIDRIQRSRFVARERRREAFRSQELRAEAAEAKNHALNLERQMLEAENSRKSKELEEARDLQLSMLPKSLPSVSGYRLGALMDTATEVGGDFYDFRKEANGLFAVVGDATGHGLQAGTMVAATKSLFNAAHDDIPLGDFLSGSSKALRGMGFRKMYMALMAVRVRGDGITLASAGMPYALVHRVADERVETLEIKGPPLGSPFDFPYQSHEIRMSQGDTLMLMSDGFQEWFRADNEMLGVPRTEHWFAELVSRDPKAIIKGMMARGRQWSEDRPHDDDITFVVLRYDGPSSTD